MKMLLEMPDELARELAREVRRQDRPRAEIVREAIAAYLSQAARPGRDFRKYRGLWRDAPDGQAFQDEMRGEWAARP